MNNKSFDVNTDNRLSWTSGDDQRPLHISSDRQQMLLDIEVSTQFVQQVNHGSSCCSTSTGACPIQPANWFLRNPNQSWHEHHSSSQIEDRECLDQLEAPQASRYESAAGSIPPIQVEEGHDELNQYERIGLAYGDREDPGSHEHLGMPCHSLNTPISIEDMRNIFTDQIALHKGVIPQQRVNSVDTLKTQISSQHNQLVPSKFYAQGANLPLPASLTVGIAIDREQRLEEVLELQPWNRPLHDNQTDLPAQEFISLPSFHFISNTGAESLTHAANSDIDLINAGYDVQATSGLSQPELHMEIPPPHDRILPSTTYTPAPKFETSELWLGPLPNLVSSSHSPAGGYRIHTGRHPYGGSREGAPSFQGDDQHEEYQIPKMNGSWRERNKQGWRRLIKYLNEPIVPVS